jgi:circadian clock protein KaiC
MDPERDKTSKVRPPQLAATGIPGLDTILHGGFMRDEVHLIQGAAGTGKTTLALQFLLAGAAAGETVLYITLSQTKTGLERIAASHGWSLANIHIHELSPGNVVERMAAEQTVLQTADVELGEVLRELQGLVDRVRPSRLVFDSIGAIEILAGTPQRYHHEIVALRHLLTGRDCASLFLGDHPAEGAPQAYPDVAFHALAGSLVQLEQSPPTYGDARRQLRIIKTRGVISDGGYHNFRIRTGAGVQVYPRLGAYDIPESKERRKLASNVKDLDAVLGGGLEQGTSCLIVGPSGSGKSTLGTSYAHAAAVRGEYAAIFLFDERPETFKYRAAGLGMDLQSQIDANRLQLVQLDTSAISPGEFAQQVRDALKDHQAKIVMIDSLTGYFNAMGQQTLLIAQMHELLTFLSRSGVVTLLTVAQKGFVSVGETAPSIDVSYLSDTILALSEFEEEGIIRRCVCAAKKRQGEHDLTIHELIIEPGSVKLGIPLTQYRGLMANSPELSHRLAQDRPESKGASDAVH